MSIPDFTNVPYDELERIIKTQGPHFGAASHEWQKRQLERTIEKVSKPHWTLIPAFWVIVATMIFAAISAWPVFSSLG